MKDGRLLVSLTDVFCLKLLNRCLHIISSIDTLLPFSFTCQMDRHALTVFFCLIAANNCSDPGAPTNGQRSLSSTTNNSVVTYTCDAGYTLQGANSRTCQSSGQWSGSVPLCNGTCLKECAVIVAAWFAPKLADQTYFTWRCMKTFVNCTRYKNQQNL